VFFDIVGSECLTYKTCLSDPKILLYRDSFLPVWTVEHCTKAYIGTV